MGQNKWIRRSGITVARSGFNTGWTIGRDVWSDGTRKGSEAAVTDVGPGGGVAGLLVCRSPLVVGWAGIRGRFEPSVLDLRRGGEGGGGGGGARPAVGQSGRGGGGGAHHWPGVARESVCGRHSIGPHWLLVARQALLILLIVSQRLA